MEITITISKETEKKIRSRSEKVGKKMENLVGELVEEVWDDHFPENGDNAKKEEFKNPFEPFIGMGSSGKTDTSERYKEILLNDVDEVGGFGGR